jgi:hypothetical protein
VADQQNRRGSLTRLQFHEARLGRHAARKPVHLGNIRITQLFGHDPRRLARSNDRTGKNDFRQQAATDKELPHLFCLFQALWGQLSFVIAGGARLSVGVSEKIGNHEIRGGSAIVRVALQESNPLNPSDEQTAAGTSLAAFFPRTTTCRKTRAIYR